MNNRVKRFHFGFGFARGCGHGVIASFRKAWRRSHPDAINRFARDLVKSDKEQEIG